MDNQGSPGLFKRQRGYRPSGALYEASLLALREAISQYIENGTVPDLQARAEGLFAYPQLEVTWDGSSQTPYRTRAYGRFARPGKYVTTLTRPELFRKYLYSQLSILEKGLRCDIYCQRVTAGNAISVCD